MQAAQQILKLKRIISRCSLYCEKNCFKAYSSHLDVQLLNGTNNTAFWRLPRSEQNKVLMTWEPTAAGVSAFVNLVAEFYECL